MGGVDFRGRASAVVEARGILEPACTYRVLGHCHLLVSVSSSSSWHHRADCQKSKPCFVAQVRGLTCGCEGRTKTVHLVCLQQKEESYFLTWKNEAQRA